jgi:hypothetical protein
MPAGMNKDTFFLFDTRQSVCVTGAKTNSLRVLGQVQHLTGFSRNPSLVGQPGWGQLLCDFVIMLMMTCGQPAWGSPGKTDRDAGVG